MPPLEPDLFGVAISEWVDGRDEPEIYERDDGYFCEGDGAEAYLAPVAQWHDAERAALRLVRGRVLDVGCGAGRVSLELQRRGVEVVGLDMSPRVVDAARRNGVQNVVAASVLEMGDDLASFDTMMLYGNNFGMLGTVPATRRWLRRWAPFVHADAQILAVSTSPYFGGAPCVTRDYFRRNRAAGRPPGQLAYRYHFHGLVGPWSKWLFVSPDEMAAVVAGTGWRLEEVIRPSIQDPYVAVLVRDHT